MVFSASLFFISIVAAVVITAVFTYVVTYFIITRRSTYVLSSRDRELAEANARITAMQESLDRSRASEQQLAHTFESLSARVLRDNSSAYLEQTRQHLHRVVDPLMSDLQKLERNIRDMEHARRGAYSSLEAQVVGLNKEMLHLRNANEMLKMSAENLNNALRSENATRGKWGEMQLRRIVELSGMVKHIDFDEQVHVSGTDGATYRPDMIIRLPHEGIIPVDAKAPMSAYLQACSAQSQEEKKTLMQKHRDALMKHIQQLSRKEYWFQFKHTPQIVVLFLPYESGLEASFAGDPQLLDKALDSKVIVAGPSTLYSFLKVISYGWMQVELSKNATKIADSSKELLNRLSIFYDHFSGVGKALSTAVNTYNKAAGSLQSRVLPKVREIEKLRGGTPALPDDDAVDALQQTTAVRD